MRIGQLATAAGLSRDALRFYEKRGLLVARRSSNGYREYPPEAVPWLRYIRTAQSLGFTLAEIEADLAIVSGEPDSAPALRDALRRKLAHIDQRVEGLVQLREELARRLDQAMADCPLRPALTISSIAT
ncbi:MAG: MerR family transcriptional regulator [Burkholderiales bacterium]|nr:MerR family transcriptional regulator [Burkholderiales bacterium]